MKKEDLIRFACLPKQIQDEIVKHPFHNVKSEWDPFVDEDKEGWETGYVHFTIYVENYDCSADSLSANIPDLVIMVNFADRTITYSYEVRTVEWWDKCRSLDDFNYNDLKVYGIDPSDYGSYSEALEEYKKAYAKKNNIQYP